APDSGISPVATSVPSTGTAPWSDQVTMYRLIRRAPAARAAPHASDGTTDTSWSHARVASEVFVPDGPPSLAAVWNCHCDQDRLALTTVIWDGGVSPSSFSKV